MDLSSSSVGDVVYHNPMKKILITAFEPFDGRQSNQSSLILSSLEENPFIIKYYLPVQFQRAFDVLFEYVEREKPSMILCLGEGPKSVPQLEHFAVNMMHARIPDNAGYQPELTKISPTGSTTLTTTFDFEKIAQDLMMKEVPFQHSFHAGTYVCNDLYYRVLSHKLAPMIGFIHVSANPSDFLENKKTIQSIVESLFLNA